MLRRQISFLVCASLVGCYSVRETYRRPIVVTATPPDAYVWQLDGETPRTLGQGQGTAERIVTEDGTRFSNWTWLTVLVAAPLFYIPINKGLADGFDRTGGLFVIPIAPLVIAATLCTLGSVGTFDSLDTRAEPLVVGASKAGLQDERITLGAAELERSSVEIRLLRPSEESTAAPPAARSTSGVVVAVFDIQDPSGLSDPKTLDQLTDYLATALTEVVGFHVVPRDQLRGRLAERKGESYQACFDESCQVELGKALAAQKSLATKLLRVGDACVLSGSLFDLKTETAEQAASVRTTCSSDALIDAVDGLARKLAAR